MADLTFEVLGSGVQIVLKDYALVIAGFTGRNQAEVQKHIDELVAIGVPAPRSVPEYYPVDDSLATSAPNIEIAGSNTSGEVEPVLLRHDGQYYLAVGSDHTDRDVERDSIALSKAACPKPLGSTVVALPDNAQDFDWDAVEATSMVDGELYQEGPLKDLLRPMDVLAEYDKENGSSERDIILFGGTLPTLNGEFVPGTEWSVSLELPTGDKLTHNYFVHVKSKE